LPVTIVGVAFIAGLDQAGNTPDCQQGAKGYGQWVGAVATDGVADILIGGPGPAITPPRPGVTSTKAKERQDLACSRHVPG